MAEVATEDNVNIRSSQGALWRPILRLGWYALALLTGGIFLASIPGYIEFIPVGISWNQRFGFNPSPIVLTLNLVTGVFALAAPILSFYLALIFFRRRQVYRMAGFLSYYLLVYAVFVSSPVQVLMLAVPQFDTPVLRAIVVLITLPLSSFLFLLFPDNRIAPKWTRWLGLTSFPLVLLILWTFPGLATPVSQSNSTQLSYIGYAILFVYLCLLLYAQIQRYRQIYSDQQRTQTKWVLYGMGVIALLWVIGSIIYSWTDSLPSDTPFPLLGAVAFMISMLAFFIFPLSLAVAVMRYQLYDIDLLINRTLVYGVLSASVVGLYALSVGVAGLAVQQRSGWAGLLLTVGITAVAFMPLQRVIQGGVDRLLGQTSGSSVRIPSGEKRAEGRADEGQPIEETAAPAGTWLRLARIGWVGLFVGGLVILILAIPGYLTRTPMGDIGSHLIFDPSLVMLTIHRLNLAGSFLAVLLSFGLAALLFQKRKNDGMALFVAYYLITHGLLLGGVVEMLEPFWPKAASVTSFILLPLISFPMTMVLLAIFPDGRLISRWIKAIIPFTFLLVLPTATEFYSMGSNQPQSQVSPFIIVAYVGLALVMISLVVAQIHRFRQVYSTQQRQQTKWVLYGFLIMIGLFVIGTGPWEYARSQPPGTFMPWWVPLTESAWILALLAVPVTLTISMLRYRLYDIDVIINRTLVYGTLSSFVVVLYILIVGGLSALFQSRGSLVLSLVATGLVAVLFNPLRLRLQRGVNRMIYGDRDEPFTVLRRLGQRLEGSGVPEEILAGIVETVATALKLPYAEITLQKGRDFEQVACYGRISGELVPFAIHYQGQTIGNLNVALRGPGESLADADHKLLRHIAQHAAPVAHTVQLTRDLRRSRTRAVTAREKERRRLRRDLHDGLGPVLASQGLKIAAVGHLLETDSERAEEILEELASQNEAVVAEIRRLVYALRPPELDELGLVGAVRDFAAGLNIEHTEGTQFDVSDHLPNPGSQMIPAAVEVAAYRIATEALTNVTRHAKAHHCNISFIVRSMVYGDELHLVIDDDGVGIPQDSKEGVGLNSMRERAEEVGGEVHIVSSPNEGTRVSAAFPLAG